MWSGGGLRALSPGDSGATTSPNTRSPVPAASVGHRPVAEIAPCEILEAVRPYEAANNDEKAHRTLQFVGQVFRYAIDTNPPALADGALCRRAEAGLVTARASLLVVEDQRSKDVVIPAEFWSTSQRSSLKQDWLADFLGRTGSLGADYWQAFGVTFALDGVLDSSPSTSAPPSFRFYRSPGRRSGCMRSGFACRQRPGGYQRPSSNPRTCPFGLSGRAGRAGQSFAHEAWSTLLWEEREWSIPQWFWHACERAGRGAQNWELGQLKGEVPSSNSVEWMHLSGVHSWPSSLQSPAQPAEAAQSDETVPSEASPRSKPGGRRPQPWWDDMWCSIWGRLTGATSSLRLGGCNG